MDFATIGQKDRLARRNLGVREAALAPDSREDGRQLVIIGLAPALRRVVVALGALNANPEERLRHRFHELGRGARRSIPDRRRAGLLTAGRGEYFTDEAV